MILGLALGVGSAATLGAVVWWANKKTTRLEIVDLCAAAPASKRSKRPKNAALDAVVLHQMSLTRGNDVQRYVRVTAHFVILPDGTVVQLHPLNTRLLASDGFNQRSVSIEFAGNLQSTNGKWWRPEKYGRDTLTAAQVESGRKLLRLLAGQGIRFVFGHRQSSADRGNDPDLVVAVRIKGDQLELFGPRARSSETRDVGPHASNEAHRH